MGLMQGIRDYRRLTRQFYRLDTKQLQDYQKNEVLSLVEHVCEKSLFYARTFSGLDVSSLPDYATLPTINKQVMMDNFDDLNTVGVRKADAMAYAMEKELDKDYFGYYLDKFVVGLSSGTSGNKGLYLTPRELTERAPALFLARGGLPLSLLPFRILFMLRVFSQGFQDLAAPGITINYKSSMTPPEDLIAAANAIRANILMAPPSLLRVLLPLADRLHRKPRRIVSYAEVLESEEKKRLSLVFGCPVVEIYQTSEGQIGSACSHGNLHINEDLVYVELLDESGHAIGPGQRSHTMLVTNLVNRAQPLLRYEMNDILELGEPCPCGSSFRTIARVIGRNDDVMWIRTKTGGTRALFPDLISRWIITTDDAIREFRVVQKNPELLEVTLDMPTSTEKDSIAARLTERFEREILAFDMSCRLDIKMDTISLPADGAKLKRFTREKGGA